MLTRVQAEQAELLDHHHLGLAEIQAAAGPGASSTPSWSSSRFPSTWTALTAGHDIAGMRVVGMDGNANAAHYPLALIAATREQPRT